jgi:hypothetical protein
MDSKALLRRAIRTSYSINKIKYREAAAKAIEDEKCSDSDSGDESDESDESDGSSSSTSSLSSSTFKVESSLLGSEMPRSKHFADLDGSTRMLLQSVTNKLEDLLKKSDTSESINSPPTSPSRVSPRPIKKAHSFFPDIPKSASALSSQQALDPINVPMLHLQSASVSLKRQEATSYLLYRRRKILAAMKQSESDENASSENHADKKKSVDCLQDGYAKVTVQLTELLQDEREETEVEIQEI